MNPIHSVCVYCASSTKIDPAYTDDARRLGTLLGGRGIRVNAVAPGFIKSKMTDVLSEDVKKAMLSVIPMKKFGEVEDIAKAVSFLAGDNAAYVTGQVLSVNGGMLMP